ncbi:MAG: hypothetical protein ACTJGH_00430 [Peptoniphilaceae bacterium]
MILDLKDIKDTTTIEIPDFDGIETVEVEVRRPKLMAMVENGEIPDPLMGAAYAAINGYNKTKEDENIEKEAKRTIDIMNLYCKVCLVNPTFEDFKEFMTDDQKTAITSWAIAPAEKLRFFRNK